MQPIAARGVTRVSIHARHRWRAVRRDGAAIDADEAVSIHARHRWRAVPAACRPPARWPTFQSTPAIAGERCAGGDEVGLDLDLVSIHARHRWRAVLATSCAPVTSMEFQSTPAIAGERCA